MMPGTIKLLTSVPWLDLVNLKVFSNPNNSVILSGVPNMK